MSDSFLSDINYFNNTVRVFESEKKIIDNEILGAEFPWFWQNLQVHNTDFINYIKNKNCCTFINGPFLSHTLMAREEQNFTNRIRSAKFEFFMEIFNRFMKDNNISYKKIHRANLNLVWNIGTDHSVPHVDHNFPHSNFIMYLSTCNRGHTLLWPEDFSTTFMIPCIKYTAATFESCWHAIRFPSDTERRITFIVTYS